jgi:hypothetical protein
MSDRIVRLVLNADQTAKWRPLLQQWRAKGEATLFACIGETFAPSSGELILELYGTIVSHAVARKACSILLKAVTR